MGKGCPCNRTHSITAKRPDLAPPSSIVGFGSNHYKYESGREGDACLTGFSPRKGDISIYVVASFPGREELLSKLGKHKMGKACPYVRKRSDVDLKVLEQLAVESVAERKRNHGKC